MLHCCSWPQKCPQKSTSSNLLLGFTKQLLFSFLSSVSCRENSLISVRVSFLIGLYQQFIKEFYHELIKGALDKLTLQWICAWSAAAHNHFHFQLWQKFSHSRFNSLRPDGRLHLSLSISLLSDKVAEDSWWQGETIPQQLQVSSQTGLWTGQRSWAALKEKTPCRRKRGFTVTHDTTGLLHFMPFGGFTY